MTSSSDQKTSPLPLFLRLAVTCLLSTASHCRSVVIETGPAHDYLYLDDYGVYATQGRQMSFNIRASNDAHVALSRLKYNATVDSYEVVIGGWTNQRSTIRRCDQCPTTWWVDHSPLNESYPMPFWVTWALNVSGGMMIRTGSGYVVFQNEFMSWYDPDPHDINYVGVSTGWTSNGTWIFEVVDGGWSSWGSWTPCAASCGVGVRARERLCNNPRPVYGRPCSDTPRQYQPCNNTDAACNGDWTGWSSWGQCSVTCGNGQQTRVRRCLTPDRPCLGSNTDQLPCLMDLCQINGSWSEWQPWTPCSSSCGLGTRWRQRTCSSPPPQFNGLPCSGNSTMVDQCEMALCPVDGQWSSWSAWSVCSASCGHVGGSSIRNRSCTNPPSQYGGDDCRGNSTDVRLCNLFNCSVNGSWSEWEAWTSCSANCGNGTKTRLRQCADSIPLASVASCVGSDTEEVYCSLEPCPLDGSWSEWQPWTSCSASCGNGTRRRLRQCNDPLPQSNGASCVGSESEDSQCIVAPCTDGGQWSAWSVWSDCPVLCGGGISSRTRECSAPPPQFIGAACNGSDVENNTCNSQNCTVAVDGAWSSWSSWSDCSLTCSIGQRVRRRACSLPPPSGGGMNCSGSDSEVVNCKLDDCLTNSATWSAWSDWTVCPVSCGLGVQLRSRTCEKPTSVVWDGKPCDGDNNETRVCGDDFCPVDGGWSDWSAWSPSCPSCGPGVTYRQRNCSNPVPLYGGINCSGTSEEQMNCSTIPCPVDGGWSDWSVWSPSCPSCGPGMTYRQRNCSDPIPLYGGTNCSGTSEEQMNCSTSPCPVDGGWSDWTIWNPPCPSCGPGVTFRQRDCSNPIPLYGGTNCSGTSEEQMNCSTSPCPIDGGWSDWTVWSPPCPSCGPGVTYRQRNCSNPVPLYGGTNCSGASEEQMNCSTIPCPVDGGWSVWSPMSPPCPSCGPGVTYRQRNCSNPVPLHGGNNCSGTSQEHINCSTIPCPVDGGWSEWTAWQACPVCGTALTRRFRNCTHPEPMYGGSNCSGESRQSSNCTNRPCPVNGVWTPWSVWSNCSVTCESGLANRFRNCSNPRPQYGGNNCSGNDTDVKKCTLRSCPMDGDWSMWTNWADCNVTCGSGWTTRKRSCNNPTPFFGGLTCPGAAKDSKTCLVGCPGSRGGRSNAPQPMEAPGAQAIGVIGIAICVALIAAIMLLDLVSINKHFAFMRKNVNYGWQRIVTKFRPLQGGAAATTTGKSQRRKTLRQSTVRRAYSAGQKDPSEEALAEQNTVTLKRTVLGGLEGEAVKGTTVERIGTVPAVVPRPGKRPPSATGSVGHGSGTTGSSGGRFEKSMDVYEDRGVAEMMTKEELDTKL